MEMKTEPAGVVASETPSGRSNPSRLSLPLLTGIGWLAMVGFDFLLHAGLLAGLYQQRGPFLLPPEAAFRLIPLGYLALALVAILLAWLLTKLGLTGWRAGGLFGLKLGALTWGALTLGLASIATASVPLLLAWFVGQTLEMGLGGAVIGSGLAGTRLRRLFGMTIGFVIVVFFVVVALQSLGIAPTRRLN